MGLGAWMGEGSLAFLRINDFIHGAYPQIDAGYCTDGPRVHVPSKPLSHRDLVGNSVGLFSLLGFTSWPTSSRILWNPLKSLNTIFSVFTVENWAAAPEAASLLVNHGFTMG